jgi:hypothetical protein
MMMGGAGFDRQDDDVAMAHATLGDDVIGEGFHL